MPSLTQAEKVAQWLAQCQHPDAQNIFEILSLLSIPGQIKTLASDLEVHDLLQKGLPVKSVRSLVNKTGFSVKELSMAMPIKERALLRLIADTSRTARLSSQESDALWRFAAVFAKAQQVMGTAEYAKGWLCTDARSLRYRKPIDVLSLSPGAELVLRVLNQLLYGVYI